MSNVMSSPRTIKIVEELNKCEMTHLVYLPDRLINSFYEVVLSEGRMTIIPVCREGEAFSIATGLMAGGKRPVVAIQNTGFLEAGDSLRATIIEVGLPLLFLVGYRGWVKDKPLTNPEAVILEPILDAWGIKYHLIETAEDAGRISAAYREALETSKPVAILVTPEEMGK